MSERKMPTGGGRKGGTQFPQIPLKSAVTFANKLVSKVHTGPQPEGVILKGVFNNAGSDGKIRASALKQYDLMTGPSSAYDATSLARDIQSAPHDELPPLLAKACLSPKVFKTLFDTFQNDLVSRAKIRQQTIQLKVHPDTADKCVAIFIDSLIYAGLGTERNGDIEILGASRIIKSSLPNGADGEVAESEIQTAREEKKDEALETNSGSQESENEEQPVTPAAVGGRQVTPKAQFQVALNLDTMDPEKLEKHMKILKRYGVIG